jgi:hypothetical protein
MRLLPLRRGRPLRRTLATQVCSSCLKLTAAPTSCRSSAPAASQKAGSCSLTGTRVTDVWNR